MNHETFISLIYNAALLLALGIIFDSITLRNYRISLWAKVLTGLSLGCVALAIMLNPWIMKPGVVFDTRSILLSLTAMFFGIIPTAIATVMALAFRIQQGGAGVYMGCSVILASVLWGYAWKALHHKWNKPYNFLEFYTLGLVNHISMLALTMLLPIGIRLTVFNSIALPVIIIYPVATVLLGQLLARRMQRRQEKFVLQESENQFRNLYDNAPLPYQSLDKAGKLVTVNQAWLQTLGYAKADVIGKNFAEFLHPDSLEHFVTNFTKFKVTGQITGCELMLIKRDSLPILVSFDGKIVTNEDGSFKLTHSVFTNITEQRNRETALRNIEWMLSKHDVKITKHTLFGGTPEANASGLILKSVGKDVLEELVNDYLSLLDTSATVYEKNGDYAIDIVISAWCNFLDAASKKQCKTVDGFDKKLCEKKLCQGASWTDKTKEAMENGEPMDFECSGGIFFYSVPIRTSGEIIGAINMSYGDPPTDELKLKEIADKYQVDLTELKQKATQYQSRPPFIIEHAKRWLQSTARIIGEIVERKQAELELLKVQQDWETIFQSIPHPTYILDKDQNILAANSTLEKAMGLSIGQMKDRKCWELMHGDSCYAPPPGCPFSDSCIQDSCMQGEMEVQALNGYYLVSCKPIFDQDGKLDKVIHIAMDITERKKAELVLAESEEKYRNLIEIANEGIWAVDTDDKTTLVNKQLLEMLGYSEAELLGKHVNTFMHQDEVVDNELKMLERKQGKGDRYIRRFHKKDGSILWALVSTQPIMDTQGKFVGSFAMFTDITAIKQTEQALRDSEARFTHFMNQIPGSVFIKDKDSRFLYVNKYMDEKFGAYDWIGKLPYDVFPADDAKEIIDDDQQVKKVGIKRMYDTITHTDEGIRYFETTKFMITKDDSESLIGGLSLDVTARIVAENERNQYATRLEILHEIDSDIIEAKTLEQISKSVLEHLQELIPCDRCSVSAWKNSQDNWLLIVLDKNKHTQVVSGSLPYNPVGFETDLTIGKTVIVPDFHEYKKELSKAAERLTTEGIVCFLYVPLVMQGEYFGSINFGSKQVNNFTEEHINLVLDIAKQMTIAVQQMHLGDEIERYTKELEIKVEERTKELKLANKELETFTYTVAHDLRSPLRSIDGFSNILLEDYAASLDEEGKKKLLIIKNNSLKMDTLIKELLALAKLNPYSMHNKTFDMNIIIAEVMESTLTSETRAMFDFQIEALPSVFGDYVLITQVWQNLIGNAVKFTQAKQEKQISIGCYEQDNETIFFIKDSGVGFDMKYVDKIFGPFQRLHKADDFEGTGIGLAIVYKIIQRHNGRIWAEGEVGKGAGFYFTLQKQTFV